jgi:hypothetical protein
VIPLRVVALFAAVIGVRTGSLRITLDPDPYSSLPSRHLLPTQPFLYLPHSLSPILLAPNRAPFFLIPAPFFLIHAPFFLIPALSLRSASPRVAPLTTPASPTPKSPRASWLGTTSSTS